MNVQQAIFTSSDRGHIKGYQLIAKSDGIDRGLSKELHRWSPSQLMNEDPTEWTINYFPLADDCVAVSRTVVGGPEYSGRGGSQVVTLIAVLRNDQFAAYQNNAMLVAQTSLALGHLRLPTELSSRLDAFQLPDFPVSPASPQSHEATYRAEDCCPESGSSEIMQLLKNRKRIAIIGAEQPRELVANMIASLPLENRRRFSFTTGLPPAIHRPFQAHFLPTTTPILNQMFHSEDITVVRSPADYREPSLASAL